MPTPILVLAVIVVAGAVLWAVNTLIPMEAQYKRVLNVLAIMFLGLWLISLAVPGVFAAITAIRIGSAPLVEVLGVIAVLGLVLWAVNAIIPMQPKYRQALYVLAVLFLVIWLVSLFVPSIAHLGH